MGFNALASLAGLAPTCVWDAADQVVHAGLHLYAKIRHYAYSCMHAFRPVGWATGCLASSDGRPVKFHL